MCLIQPLESLNNIFTGSESDQLFCKLLKDLYEEYMSEADTLFSPDNGIDDDDEEFKAKRQSAVLYSIVYCLYYKLVQRSTLDENTIMNNLAYNECLRLLNKVLEAKLNTTGDSSLIFI